MLTKQDKQKAAKMHFDNNDCCKAVLVAADGQIFHEDKKSFAMSHRYKVGGELLLVKKSDFEVKEDKVEAPELSAEKAEKPQEVQPIKKYVKKRGRRPKQ